ncbi:hypothetical protein Ancab_009430, partial [Ancistrocladus abbreviatus]
MKISKFRVKFPIRKRTKINTFSSIVEKLDKRLQRRKAKCLSYAGRATLIRSVVH